MSREPERRVLARRHFKALSEAEKREALCRLVDGGMSEYGAAAAGGVSVEFVRRLLAQRRERIG